MAGFQPFQFLYQCRPLEVQQFRGLTFIAAGFFERSTDQVVLDAADIALEIDPAFREVDFRRGRPVDACWMSGVRSDVSICVRPPLSATARSIAFSS